MDFHPNNPVVKLCLQGKPQEAWHAATHDGEKFISAHFLARSQEAAAEKLKWYEVALALALKINDDTVKSALPILCTDIAQCHEALHHPERAKQSYAQAQTFDPAPTDTGPFFHGTKAALQPGDFLNPGGASNYQAGLTMNHIYFTANLKGAGLAAGLAKGDLPGRVFRVEPTGPFEHDPNVTNQKFPGNPTRSYRSVTPLRIVDEVTGWEAITPEELEKWRQKLAESKDEIIN